MARDSTYIRRKRKRRAKPADPAEDHPSVSPPTPSANRISSNALMPAFQPGLTPLENILPLNIKEEPGLTPKENIPQLNIKEEPGSPSLAYECGTSLKHRCGSEESSENMSDCSTILNDDRGHISDFELPEEKAGSEKNQQISAPQLRIKMEPADECDVNEVDHTIAKRRKLSEVSAEEPSSTVSIKSEPLDDDRKMLECSEAAQPHFSIKSETSNEDECSAHLTVHTNKPVDEEVVIVKHEETSRSKKMEIIDLTLTSDEDCDDSDDKPKSEALINNPKNTCNIKREPVENIESTGCQKDERLVATAAEGEKIDRYLEILRSTIKQEPVSVREEEKDRNSDQGSVGASINVQDNVSGTGLELKYLNLIYRIEKIDIEDCRQKIKYVKRKQSLVTEDRSRSLFKIRKNNQKTARSGEKESFCDRTLSPQIPQLINVLSSSENTSSPPLLNPPPTHIPYSPMSDKKSSFPNFSPPQNLPSPSTSVTYSNPEIHPICKNIPPIRPITVSNVVVPIPPQDQVPFYDRTPFPQIPHLINNSSMSEKNSSPPVFSTRAQNLPYPSTSLNYTNPRQCSISTNVVVPISPRDQIPFSSRTPSPQIPHLINNSSMSEKNSSPPVFSIRAQNLPYPSTSVNYTNPRQCSISTNVVVPISPRDQIPFCSRTPSPQIPQLISASSSLEKNSSTPIFGPLPQNISLLNTSTYSNIEQNPIPTGGNIPPLRRVWNAIVPPPNQVRTAAPQIPHSLTSVFSTSEKNPNPLFTPPQNLPHSSTAVTNSHPQLPISKEVLKTIIQAVVAPMPNFGELVNETRRQNFSNNLSENSDALGVVPRFQRDPRLVRVPQTIFHGRIGSQLCLSLFPYQNAGKVFLSDDEFSIFVLQWNPKWLRVSTNIPPICDCYTKVESAYKNDLMYYNTYTPLHLLSLWLRLAFAFSRNPVAMDTKCELVEKGEPGKTKISCSVVLKCEDNRPKREDVILCTATATDGNAYEFFGRIVSVMQKPWDLRSNQSVPSAEWIKFKIDFWCSLDPSISLKNQTVRMRIVLSLRVALMQNEALRLVNESLQNIVHHPRSNSPRLRLVRCDPSQDQKLLRDQIVQNLDESTVVLVDTSKILTESSSNSAISLTRQVVYALSQRPDALVLVCTKSMDVLNYLAYHLRPYDPVIAIRSAEIDMGDTLRPFTLEEKLKSKKLFEIFKKRPITLTLFSSFMPVHCKKMLAKKPNVLCIVDGADMCTEAETALPLSLASVKKLVLTGNPSHLVSGLPEILQNYRYHVSLFRRLYEALL